MSIWNQFNDNAKKVFLTMALATTSLAAFGQTEKKTGGYSTSKTEGNVTVLDSVRWENAIDQKMTAPAPRQYNLMTNQQWEDYLKNETPEQYQRRKIREGKEAASVPSCTDIENDTVRMRTIIIDRSPVMGTPDTVRKKKTVYVHLPSQKKAPCPHQQPRITFGGWVNNAKATELQDGHAMGYFARMEMAAGINTWRQYFYGGAAVYKMAGEDTRKNVLIARKDYEAEVYDAKSPKKSVFYDRAEAFMGVHLPVNVSIAELRFYGEGGGAYYLHKAEADYATRQQELFGPTAERVPAFMNDLVIHDQTQLFVRAGANLTLFTNKKHTGVFVTGGVNVMKSFRETGAFGYEYESAGTGANYGQENVSVGGTVGLGFKFQYRSSPALKPIGGF